MSLEFVNDPMFDEVPVVGGVPVLVASRMECGLAVRWDPVSGDPVALSVFLGEEFVSFEGRVMQRAGNGTLVPVDWARRPVVVVRPPAGPVFTVGDADELKSRFALVVDVPAPELEADDQVGSDVDGDGSVDVYEAQGVVALSEELGKRGLAKSGLKAELVARLREDDAAKAAALVAPPAGDPGEAPVDAAGDVVPVS